MGTAQHNKEKPEHVRLLPFPQTQVSVTGTTRFVAVYLLLLHRYGYCFYAETFEIIRIIRRNL